MHDLKYAQKEKLPLGLNEIYCGKIVSRKLDEKMMVYSEKYKSKVLGGLSADKPISKIIE